MDIDQKDERQNLEGVDLTGLKHLFKNNKTEDVVRVLKNMSRQDATLLKTEVELESEKAQTLEENEKYKQAISIYNISIAGFSLICFFIGYKYDAYILNLLKSSRVARLCIATTFGVALANPFSVNFVKFYDWIKSEIMNYKNQEDDFKVSREESE